MEKDIMGTYGYNEKYFVTEKKDLEVKQKVKFTETIINMEFSYRYFNGDGIEISEEEFYSDND